MAIKHTRRGPAIWLAIGAAGSTVLLAQGARQGRGRDLESSPATLDELHRAAAAPGAGAEDWRRFARALTEAKRWAHAIEAGRRALELDPFDNECREHLTIALAGGERDDELFDALHEWMLLDARAVLRAMSRAEIARYADHPRYRPLLAEARSQSVD